MNKKDQEAADLIAVHMNRAEYPGLTNTHAVFKLMELGIIKVDGEAPTKRSWKRNARNYFHLQNLLTKM